ncbi:hypothetical protein GX48_01355 [Paracoccidioides brasiliensis]|nr:hypothetical protein GX48_01355 [Paracoccidioides brasiliensis]
MTKEEKDAADSSGITNPDLLSSDPVYHAQELPIRSVCYAPAGWYSADWPNTGPPVGWYFFYGTLANESKLAAAMWVEEPLCLRPAKVLGYKLMLSGDHLALADGPTAAEIRGKALHVDLPMQAQGLRRYVPDAFTTESCQIHFVSGDRKVIDGFTFMWDGTVRR